MGIPGATRLRWGSVGLPGKPWGVSGVLRTMEIRIDDDARALVQWKGGVVGLDFIAPVG